MIFTVFTPSLGRFTIPCVCIRPAALIGKVLLYGALPFCRLLRTTNPLGSRNGSNSSIPGRLTLAKKRASLLEVLRAPIRWRLLEIFNEYERLSPVQIVHLGLAADIESMKDKKHREKLMHVDYHVKQLAEAGLLELADTQPVRGATEHFYRATAKAYFSDEEWAKLDQHEREEISHVILVSFVARAEEARHAATFDSRADRWLAWLPLVVDERGWKEISTASAAFYAEVEHIAGEARRRLDLAEERETGGEAPQQTEAQEAAAEAIHMTVAVATFESPTPRSPDAESSELDDQEGEEVG